jgi:hypothetical protein
MKEKLGHINANTMKRKVVSIDNLPSQVPVFSSLTLWLALDHWHVPQWMYYALGIFIFIMCTSAIIKIKNQIEVNIFKEDEYESK